MSLMIAGIGTAVPEHHIEQPDAAQLTSSFCCTNGGERGLLAELYEHSGVAKRHSVVLERSDGPIEARQQFFHALASPDDRGPSTQDRMSRYEASAGPLALRAARAALDDARMQAENVTHVVTVSCTGFAAPGFDFELIRGLGLSPGVARTHVGFMGCHGALNALRVARAFVDADPGASVLVASVELCTLHHYYGWQLDKVIANSLFADGSAALVGVASTANRRAGWNVVANGSLFMRDSEPAMSWRVGDHGFEMTLSRKVPELIRQNLGPWLKWWLRANGLSMGEIGSWAIHPGGPRILDACRAAAGLSDEHVAESRRVLAEFGNMSSATVLFIIERLRRARAALPCVVLGFGPGMAVEAAIIARDVSL